MALRMIGNIVKTAFGKRKPAAKDPGYKSVQERIEELPELQKSAYTAEAAAAQKSGAETLRKLGERGLERAEGRFISSEAPGAGIARQDIESSTAQSVQDIKEAAGGSAGALGAIAQVAASKGQDLRQLAQSNQMYRSQAERDKEQAISQAITQQSTLEAQASGQEAQAGLMLAQEEKDIFQSKLQKQLTGIEQQAAHEALQKQLDAQRAASQRQVVGNIIGGVVGGVGSFLSDINAKTDIVKITSIKGINIYSFKYKKELDMGDGNYVGVIAQEVDRIPNVVKHTLPYKKVDYNKLKEYLWPT